MLYDNHHLFINIVLLIELLSDPIQFKLVPYEFEQIIENFV